MTGHGSHAAIETLAAFVLVVTGAIVLALAAHQRRHALVVGVPSAVPPASAEPGDPGRLSVPGAVVVALSLGAAAIHLAAGPPHVEELGDLGLGFYWAALFQGGWAMAYAARSARSTRPLAWVGIAGSLAISAAWLWSRTLGLPVGPDAWRPEAIGVPDAVATTFQLLLAAWLAWELPPVSRSWAILRRLRSGSTAMVAGVPIIGIVFLATTLAVAGGAAGHDHGGQPEASAGQVTAAHGP